jgi:hypothetical protein
MLTSDQQMASYDYWVSLSIEDRSRVLKEGAFWSGFVTYFWQYLPDNVKEYLVAKSDS